MTFETPTNKGMNKGELASPSRLLFGRGTAMIDAREFAQKQFELAGEFGKFVFDHPEIDERLPEGAFIYFEVAELLTWGEISRQS